MKLIIDIPEEEYNECKMQVELMRQEGIIIESLNTALRIFVANGTPLPKGHGRLVDYDEMKRLANCCGEFTASALSYIKPQVIIEADGGDAE